ncbi:hypothetical protein [Pantoea sp. BAV 3049]|uniref:hypothetical protein n=1 Tax=Pantoea sp. BAV 3049 TaxID=2654188 RepID=UPI00131D5150|nr:hypothetical protein [Pantoea sp. BAV 3049]
MPKDIKDTVKDNAKIGGFMCKPQNKVGNSGNPSLTAGSILRVCYRMKPVHILTKEIRSGEHTGLGVVIPALSDLKSFDVYDPHTDFKRNAHE